MNCGILDKMHTNFLLQKVKLTKVFDLEFVIYPFLLFFGSYLDLGTNVFSYLTYW